MGAQKGKIPSPSTSHIGHRMLGLRRYDFPLKKKKKILDLVKSIHTRNVKLCRQQSSMHRGDYVSTMMLTDV